MATPSHPTLYERLGGVYSIAAVVADLIDRVMDDPRLNANPASMRRIIGSREPAALRTGVEVECYRRS